MARSPANDRDLYKQGPLINARGVIDVVFVIVVMVLIVTVLQRPNWGYHFEPIQVLLI